MEESLLSRVRLMAEIFLWFSMGLMTFWFLEECCEVDGAWNADGSHFQGM